MDMQETTRVLTSVAEFLRRPHELYIDGRWTPSTGSTRLPVHDPATGSKIAEVVNATREDVDAAVQAAQRAFRDGRWSRLLPGERERILLRFADLVEAHTEELAQLETLEQGKGISVARMFELGSSVSWMRYTAGLATKITGRTFDVSIPLPPGARYTASTRRQPLGVVAGIVPWNFPLMIAVWKIMPALAAGNTIVVKPSETTPLTVLRLAELAAEAGIPPGVLNVITGDGKICGDALVSHPQVAKISFTGSTPVGKHIARVAADRLAHVTLELGGKNPAIVLADADPEAVVQGLLTAGFLNQGQVCASCSRIFVEAPLFDRLASAFEAAVKGMVIGPGLDPRTQINPLVSSAHQARVLSFLDDARRTGADLVTGGPLPAGDGFYVPPVLVLNPSGGTRLTREEVFGPVLNVTRVADAAEAIALANDSPMGLAASLWTGSLSAAMDLPPQIEAGTVWVNTHVMIDPNMPFGGFKQSGSGRDFGVDWLDAYTETKSVCIRH